MELTLARELLEAVRAEGVPSYRQTLPRIDAEVRRCRRYEHPLAVLAVVPDRPGAGEVPAAPRLHVEAPVPAELEVARFLLLGTLLRDVTRESDIVVYAAQKHAYAVFLPEADASAAAGTAARLARICHERTGVLIRAGVAEFPTDGLTVEALLGHAAAVLAAAPPIRGDESETPVQEVAWVDLRSAR